MELHFGANRYRRAVLPKHDYEEKMALPYKRERVLKLLCKRVILALLYNMYNIDMHRGYRDKNLHHFLKYNYKEAPMFFS